MSVSVLSIATASLLLLDIRVEDTDWVGTYDTLEVHRSVLGEGGPYVELSAGTWLQAILPSNAFGPSLLPGPSVNIVGLGLQLRVNEQFDVSLVFTGVNPLTTSAVATQITTGSSGHVSAFVDIKGKLIIESLPVGGLASLRVVGGDAAPLLGLPTTEPDSLAFGNDPRIPLIQGTNAYVFKDYYSDPSYFYKTRFSNRALGLKSAFSNAFSANRRMGVDPSQIAIGFVKLAGLDGRPAAKQEVTVFNTFLAKAAGGFTVLGGPQLFLTDMNGYVEFPLIRGVSFDVGIGGTALTRHVTTPMDPTILKFDVLDPAYGVDDNFSVQRADIPYAIRTSP